ncbi:MAG: DUF308 domain-containing protein [Sphaerochaetaceae bacterium]|jgi:uncharacterized membrane protein HdeD (DUF308 family)|nr:DUF308 domain-containing protein [Sphaerochaetaceae bacterium]MDX9938336.1 DUF308 domain-containing protein [Sphaerochaetaceae bacterium]
MKAKGRWIVQLLIAILIVILGIFILVRQELFKQILVIALGIVAIVTGITSLATMNRYSFNRFNHMTTLVKGVLGIIVGVLAVIMPLATGEAAWTVIIYVLAAEMVLGAIVMFIDAIAVRSAGFPASPLVTEGIVSIILAAMLFLFPKSVADLLVTILGITIIVIGMTVGFVALWIRKRNAHVIVGSAETVSGEKS